MHRTLWCFLFGILCGQVMSGQSFSGQTVPKVMADMVLRNGAIYTVNPSQPWAEAIAIVGDMIVFVGTNQDALAFIDEQTEVIELNGRMVLPGLHDVHMHPLEAGSPAAGDCLLDNTETDPENFIPALQACNLSPNSNGWILAGGHSIFTLYEAQRPPRLILDDLYPDVPVAILEETSHSLWVNSRALEVSGISAATPDPVGGHIIKWDDEEPSGILLDNAGDFVLQMALASTPDIDAANYDGLVNYSLPLLAEMGITSICEGRTYWKRNYHQIWQDIKNDGLLTARVVLAPWVYPEDIDADLITALQNLYDAGDDMLRITQLKCYSDGIIINATAALHDPYLDNLGLPFSNGLNYLTAGRLGNLITILEQSGYDFHIHAIGDRGITEALDAIEAARDVNGDIGARHRITHLEVLDSLDLPRFADLDVTADAQVAGDFTNPENWGDNEPFLGPERSDNFIPLRSLYDAGARISLSSDWDVSSPNPFVAMEHAITRDPQALPTLDAIIEAYTINAAYVMRQETDLGSIEAGKLADVIVLDQHIFNVPAGEIGQTSVLLTILGGEIVHQDPAISGIHNNAPIPETFTLAQNFPNPFNGSTQLRFTMKTSAKMTLSIFNVNGELVHQLFSDSLMTAGTHTFSWDGVDSAGQTLSSGVYYYQLRSARERQAKKMLLVK